MSSRVGPMEAHDSVAVELPARADAMRIGIEHGIAGPMEAHESVASENAAVTTAPGLPQDGVPEQPMEDDSADEPHSNAAEKMLKFLRSKNSKRMGSIRHFVVEADVKAALKAAVRKGAIDDARLTQLARKIVERVDTNGDGVLDTTELAFLVEQHPGLMALLSAPAAAPAHVGGASTSGAGQHAPTADELSIATASASAAASAAIVAISSHLSAAAGGAHAAMREIPRVHRHTYRLIGCGAPTRRAAFWAAIVLVGMVFTAVQAAGRFAAAGASPAIVTARVGGQLTYFFLLLTLLTMLRRTTAMVARFPSIARWIPLDALPTMHVHAAVGMLCATALHLAGHITNFTLGRYGIEGAVRAEGALAAYASLVPLPGLGAVASGMYLTFVILAMLAGFLLRHRFFV